MHAPPNERSSPLGTVPCLSEDGDRADWCAAAADVAAVTRRTTRAAVAAGAASPLAARGIRTTTRAGDDFLRRAHFRDGTQGQELGYHDEDIYSGEETEEYEVSDDEPSKEELGRRDELIILGSCRLWPPGIRARLSRSITGRGIPPLRHPLSLHHVSHSK